MDSKSTMMGLWPKTTPGFVPTIDCDFFITINRLWFAQSGESRSAAADCTRDLCSTFGPILAVGKEPSYIQVFASEEEFTTTSGSSSTFYTAEEVIDSQGRLYALGRVVPFGKRPSWRDMGTSRYRVFVETKLEKTIDFEAAPKIVSDLVRALQLLGR